MNQKMRDKMIKARLTLLLDHPFWGSLAMRLVLEEAPWCQTAATDGIYLFYNPEFIDSLSPAATMFIFAHEVGHCANGHTWRGEGKEHDRWNIAIDYAINGILKKANFEVMEDVYLDPSLDPLSAEEIYAKIPPNPKGQGNQKGKSGSGQGQSKGKSGQGQGKQNQQGQKPNQKGSDPGGCGSVIQPEQMDKGKRDELREEWKGAVAQAMQMCQGRGDVPESMIKDIKDILDPPLPWFVLLRDFVEHAARNDYSWRRVNVRYLNQDIILPSLISEELPEVIIAIDTSGSTVHLLDRFANEVSGVLASYKTSVRVIYCDAAVHGEEEYSTEDLPIKLKPIGGGGTSFKPVFEYVEKKGITGACMIFLTDLDGYFPEQEPEYPVLWVTPNDQKAPFGITIKFNNIS